MRRLVLSLLLCGSGLVHGFSNEPSGFRGIDWDESFEHNQMELVPVKDGEGADFYARRDNDLTLGQVKLESLSYAYLRGRFAAIVFRTAGEKNESALLDYLAGEYGKGARAGNPMSLHMTWAGTKARIEVYCQTKLVCLGYMSSTKAYTAYQAQQPKAGSTKATPAGRGNPG